ncbi:unnamed protein product [Hymenolepis diminuta]|uniref:Uncharacterized protein n=1 Tax=Hymenolepis diminuta TaxID=6216 RepID=A0A564Z0J8_HYMDI|nr:unnamed protein product [Hymenolepis diminuta]
MTYHPSTKGTHSPSDNYPTNIRSNHSQMPILQRTSSSSRMPYRRRRCQNCNDNGHKEVFYRDSYRCDTRLHFWERRSSRSATLQIEVSNSWTWTGSMSSTLSSPLNENETQDSGLTYHSGHTKDATCTTIINSHSKESDVTLLSPMTSKSAISIFHKLVVYQKRLLQTLVHSLHVHFV